MIRRHMQRGDIYPHVQLKCWKHIRTPSTFILTLYTSGF